MSNPFLASLPVNVPLEDRHVIHFHPATGVIGYRRSIPLDAADCVRLYPCMTVNIHVTSHMRAKFLRSRIRAYRELVAQRLQHWNQHMCACSCGRCAAIDTPLPLTGSIEQQRAQFTQCGGFEQWASDYDRPFSAPLAR